MRIEKESSYWINVLEVFGRKLGVGEFVGWLRRDKK